MGTESAGPAGKRKRDTRLDDGVDSTECDDSLLGGRGGGGRVSRLDGSGGRWYFSDFGVWGGSRPVVDSMDKPVVDNMDTRGAGVASEMTLVALSA